MKKIYIGILSVLILCACSKIEPQEMSEIAKEVTPPKPIILALGDSLTAGYGVELSDSYPSKLEKKLNSNLSPYKVINAGISGDTSAGLLARVPLYLDQKPQIVIIVIGGNDGLRGLSTQELKKNILQIIDAFPKETKIVLGGMDVPMNLGEKYRTDFLQVYREVAGERKEVYFLPFFLEGVAGNPELNISDKIHPNPAGYEIIVDNLYEFLRSNTIL